MTQDDFIANRELLALLMSDEPPTPEQVIEARNQIWQDGRDINPNIFAQLVELAVLAEKRREKLN